MKPNRMWAQARSPWGLLTAAMLLAIPCPPPPAEAALRQVRVVAVSGTEAPGTALTFGNAFDTRDFYLSPDGDVVFGAPLSGGVFDYGFWRWSASETSLIARHGAAAAGTAGFFDFSNGQSRFGALGYWNFHGLMSALTGGSRSLWLGTGTTLSRVAGENDVAPFVADGLFANLPQSLATRPVFGGGGVTFIATLKDGPEPGSSVTSENDLGIWSGDLPSGLRLVAREDQAMPGLPGQKFANFGRPIMSPLGVVWFTANARLPASNDGLFRWSIFDGLSLVHQRSDFGTISKITVSPTDDLQFIAITSTPADTQLITHDPLLGPMTVATVRQPSPDRDGQPTGPNFKVFLHHILPATRRTVLLASTAAGWRGIWREDGSVLKLLVRNGDPAVGMAGNQTFLSLIQVVATEDALVAFEATTSGTAGSTGWWKIDDTGVVKPLIVPGDTIELTPGDTRTVTTVKGPIVNGGNPSELGVGYDGIPTHTNREEILLQVTFNNFTSSALVLAQGAEFLVVNSTGDDQDLEPGDGVCDTGGLVHGEAECSLRAAIMEANALAGANTIRFNIPADDGGFDGGENAWIIRTPAVQLPDVTESARIDAATQPGYVGVPRIVLDGTGTVADEQSGITLEGGSSEVSGLSVVGYAGHGIHAAGGAGHRIRANYVGVLPSGTAKGNKRSGIEVLDVPDVTIGGTGAADRNVVSANDPPGGTIGYNIHITGARATGAVVTGNYVGTDPTGLAPLGGRIGVNLDDASGAIVGGDTEGARNVISGNSSGIEITGLLATGNQVRGNYIGVGADGSTPVPNSLGGIVVTEATGTQIGGLANVIGAPPGNVIAGNASNRPDVHGIRISPRAHGTVIQGNLIGLDAGGSLAVPNGGDGVHLSDADSLTLGALDERGRNVISGNDSSGVVIELGRGHRIYSNVVGLSRDLAAARGNGGHGVDLDDTPGVDVYGNIIGANGGHGVRLSGAGSDGTRLERNWIGTEPFQRRDYGNVQDGLRIGVAGVAEGPDSTRVGGDDPEDGNTVWFNGEAGVRILTGVAHRARGNSFHRNERLGLDLLGPGVTPNDDGDPDLGPNLLINMPLLTRAGIDTATGTLRVRGVLPAAPSTTYTVDVYGNRECDPEGYGEGETWLTSVEVTTGADSLALLDISLMLAGGPATWPSYLTTMTTGSDGTSEFSNCRQVDVPDRASTSLRVNSIGDASDLNPGDGACSTGGTVGAEPECTLRAAIEESAALAGAQTVHFAIDGPGPFLIQPVTPLPAVSDIDLDATTQPGYGFHPLVAIDASLLANGPGLALAGGAAVSGLAIIGAPLDGLQLSGSGNSVGLCDVGLNPITGGAAPNGRHGIYLEGSGGQVGGPAGTRPNRIAFNGGDGVRVATGAAHALSGNSIHDNTGLGINLVGGDETPAGVTANDPGDVDDGANRLLNRPVLTGARVQDGQLIIEGIWPAAPGRAARIEVFANGACDPAGSGEGLDYLGSFDVLADAAGEAPLSGPVSLPTGAAGPLFLTATATDSEGNSSEFSNCYLLPAVPAVLLGWEAALHPGGVRLTWSVRGEGGIVGFRIWRRSLAAATGTTTAWEERTTAPLVGMPGESRDPAMVYRFEDTLPVDSIVFEYRLEALTRSGGSEMLGPFRLVATTPAVAALRVLNNPVRGRATLAVELPRPATVRVMVHDVSGRLRRILTSGAHPAGYLEIGWDPSDAEGRRLPAGLYFLRLDGAAAPPARVVLLR